MSADSHSGGLHMVGFVFAALLITVGIVGISKRHFRWTETGSRYGGAATVDRSFPLWHIGLVCLILGLLLVGLISFRQVPTGHRAVLVQFGDVVGSRSDGPTFVWPWIDTKNIDIRLKEVTFGAAPSSDDGAEVVAALGPIEAEARGGGSLTVEQTIQYQVEADRAAALYEEIGPDYVKVIVLPAARNCVRDVTVNYGTIEAYTEARPAIAADTRECLAKQWDGTGVTIVDVLVREVTPAEGVVSAQNAKVQATQDLARKDTEKRIAERDADIRRTEARGIRDQDQIIQEGLSESLLVFRYIETLRDLIDSPNNTVVVLPFDQELTPLLNLPGQGGVVEDGDG